MIHLNFQKSCTTLEIFSSNRYRSGQLGRTIHHNPD